MYSNFTNHEQFMGVVAALKRAPSTIKGQMFLNLFDTLHQLGREESSLSRFQGTQLSVSSDRKIFPYLLVRDPATRLPKIYHVTDATGIYHYEKFHLSGADMLWLSHVGVQLVSPHSMVIEAVTMGTAFPVLLPLFQGEFGSNPPEVMLLLAISCFCLYPVLYQVASWYSPSKFPAFTPGELFNQTGRMFLVLLAALAGTNLDADTVWEKIAKGTAFAAAAAALINRYQAPAGSWSQFILQIVTDMMLVAATFAPILITVLKVLPTYVAPYISASVVAYLMPPITTVTIITLFLTWGKYIVNGVAQKIGDYTYGRSMPSIILEDGIKALLYKDIAPAFWVDHTVVLISREREDEPLLGNE